MQDVHPATAVEAVHPVAAVQRVVAGAADQHLTTRQAIGRVQRVVEHEAGSGGADQHHPIAARQIGLGRGCPVGGGEGGDGIGGAARRWPKHHQHQRVRARSASQLGDTGKLVGQETAKIQHRRERGADLRGKVEGFDRGQRVGVQVDLVHRPVDTVVRCRRAIGQHQRVGAIAAVETAAVGNRAAENDRVVAAAGVDHILPAAGINDVGAVKGGDRIVARGAAQAFAKGIGADDIHGSISQQTLFLEYLRCYFFC